MIAESPGTAVALDGLRVWPDRFEFRLLIFGVAAVYASTSEELARLRSAGQLLERLDAMRPEPDVSVEVAECTVTLPALESTPCRLQVIDMSTMAKRSRVRYLASPTPSTGDALVWVSVAGLSGAAVLSGEDLRAAATRARPPGTSVR